MTTIRDVARHASVSPSTVSLVLRRAESVHPKTRRNVEKAIGELGYRRRSAGRPAKSGRGNHVALVYPGASVHLREGAAETATRRWFEVVRQELMARGHHLSYFGSAALGRDPAFEEVVRQREVDGVIFIGASAEVASIRFVNEQGLPVLVVNRQPRNDEFNYVDIDNYGGGREAVRYLHRRGHRRIALVPLNGRSSNQQFCVDRLRGMQDAMHELNLEPAALVTSDREPIEAQCAALMEEVLASGVTAACFTTDCIAMRCLNQLEAMGVAVPERLSLVGFDNNATPSGMGRRLTSVGTDGQMVGRYVAELMQRLVRDYSHLLNLSARIRTFIGEHDTVADGPAAGTIEH